MAKKCTKICAARAKFFFFSLRGPIDFLCSSRCRRRLAFHDFIYCLVYKMLKVKQETEGIAIVEFESAKRGKRPVINAG